MVRLIAVAAIAFAAATSAQAMSPVPLHQPDGLITQVAFWCGPFRTRVNGVCVARTTSARPAATSAGARDGVEALAFGGTEI